MPNMSYCRFENTLRDLQDCNQALTDGLRADNREERQARHKLVQECVDILETLGLLEHDIDDEDIKVALTELDEETETCNDQTD